jgi:hypothetical protein
MTHQSNVLLGLFCTLKRQEEFKIFAHSQFSAGLQDEIVLQMREIRATCPANLDQSVVDFEDSELSDVLELDSEERVFQERPQRA